METELMLPAVLLAVGVALFFLEAIIPSMGAITVLGLVSVTAAVFLAFQTGMVWGVIFLLLALLSIPAAVLFFFFVVRKTGIIHSQSESDYEKTGRESGSLVGQEGVVLSDLRPTGTATINGRRVDVVAEGSFIESGARVKVVRADGFSVLVRRATR